MSCLEVQQPDGTIALIPVAKGEVIHTGPGVSILRFTECKEGTVMPNPAVNVDAELHKAGLKLGDSIAWVTKHLGIKQCAPCKARQEILNSIREIGIAETIRRIKETL